MPTDVSDINNLLDSLYLELLHLTEQHTDCRVKIERLNNSGQLLLAKTRYNHGSQSVGVCQIPTENSDAFKALAKVEEDRSATTVAGTKKHLVRHKTDKSQGYVDPIMWFSVFPPSTLRNAAEQFKKSIDLVVEAANIQTEMLVIMNSMDRLKLVKKQLVH